MKDKLRFLVSLPNQNHYQQAQAKSAKTKGAGLYIDVEILDAQNDPVMQSQQLLTALQSSSQRKYDAILVEPLTSTALAKVAEVAVGMGVAWVLLNCDAEYVKPLAYKASAPVFAVSRDHAEIGRIQGRQFAALLPHGGNVLYLQGPNTSSAATQRTEGVLSVKPDNITLRNLRSQWTSESAYQAVKQCLGLSTTKPESTDLIGCQYDGIAQGARQALREVSSPSDRARWLSLPLTGVDGLPEEGQLWVRRGELTATVVTPLTTGVAMDMLVSALKTGQKPSALTFLEMQSYPSLDVLSEIGAKAKVLH